MNDYDRENLAFLLSVDKETLKDWYDSVSEDDHEYASEIMAAYSEELTLKMRFYLVEEVDLTADYMIPDAREYLKKYKL